MTAANEKPLPCPFCGQSPELSVGSTTTNSAVTCKCISPSKHRRTWISGDVWNRRAQTAEQPIGWYQDPNTVVLNSNNPMAGTDIHGMALYVRAQPAEAVDDAKYTQGFAYDGVVILKDGQPITIDEVLAMLNARARAERPLESLLGEDMQDAED